MSLTRIQKTFVRLAAVNKWGPMGSYRSRRRRLLKYSPSKCKVRIEVIDAVTGEKTSAKAFEDSAYKLRKWLKLRNVRAEFTEVLLKKKSTWFKLTDTEFIDYPVIIKVGSYKAPYLIKRIQDRVTKHGKVTISIQLETTDNIDYLSILSAKKELLETKKEKK
jgi:hypothetical protein